jgi:hypothetical protein
MLLAMCIYFDYETGWIRRYLDMRFISVWLDEIGSGGDGKA